MKNILLKIIVIMLIFIGSVSSCKNDDIDYSNIENLYAQPLPVIQKCVEGKWEEIAVFGGYAGVSYSKNMFVDIYNDHCIMTLQDGSQIITYYTWKEYTIDDMGYKTWVMWDNESNQVFRYFIAIKNDTLGVGLPLKYFTSSYKRIK